MMCSRMITLLILIVSLTTYAVANASDKPAPSWLQDGQFSWVVGTPVLFPVDPPDDHRYSVKDPTIVRFKDKWHLFCTIRSEKRSHQIEYLSFPDWKEADKAKRHVLDLTDGYYCAPQVFYFRPHKKWYLICQIADQSRKPGLQPAWSTNDKIDDVTGWTKPVLLFDKQPDNVSMWIDFWVICDANKAYLFFTSLNGKMWRADTTLSDFPKGWSRPRIVLEGDIFEASHTYKLKDMDNYLTVVEAQADGRRYYKAYLADTLDGDWQPLAATREKPFASPVNTRQAEHWTDSFSHGELIRAGYDETLTVDPVVNLRFLFQGVSGQDMSGKPYGQIPWKLGLLTFSQ